MATKQPANLSSVLITRLERGTALSSDEIALRVAKFSRTPASSAIRIAAAALVQGQIRRTPKSGDTGVAAARTAAGILGAGYACARVVLGEPTATALSGPDGARQLLRRSTTLDQSALVTASGGQVLALRSNLLDVLSRGAPSEVRSRHGALFDAGFGLAAAETELAGHAAT